MPTIHVVGTNGKTSVVHLVSSLLVALGVRVGATTSPHLEDVAERFRIDGRPIDDALLDRACVALEDVRPGVEARIEQPVTFFDAVTAIALWSFVEAEVDVAVVEAGIGGIGDATNVVDSAVTVITPVGFDHPQLGGTLDVIAREKASVVAPGGILLSAPQPPAAAAAIAEVAAERGARLIRVGHEIGVLTRRPAPDGQLVGLRGLGDLQVRARLPLRGVHQATNAALALAAVQAHLGRTDLDLDRVRNGFVTAAVPGRVELVRRPGGPSLLLDGAHDVAAVRALVAAVREGVGTARCVVVLGVGGEREAGPLVAHLRELPGATFVVTRSEAPTATPVAVVAGQLRAAGIASVEAPDVAAACETALALAGSDGLVVVTGSLHLVGAARRWVRGRGGLPCG